jgi:AcrR family transcriptional regulator
MELAGTHPGNRRGARSVQRILDAAARLFGREGFQGASMTAVARAAGVSKGLLHYHFRSKEHLLIEATRATFQQLHLRFDERFERGESGLSTALDALDALWATVRELRGLAPFMVETVTLASPGSSLHDELQAFYRESMQLLEAGIHKAFAAEGPVVPAPRLAMLVRVCLHGVVVELAMARTEAELARVDQAYADLRELFRQVATAHEEGP